MQDVLIDFLKKQGGFTLLLLFLSWKLYGKMEQLETRIEKCEADKFQLILESNKRSDDVIERNTAALTYNTESLEYIQTAIGLKARKKIIPITAREGNK